jgi:hypothetical protein
MKNPKATITEHGSTNILRLAIVLLGLAVLAIFAYTLSMLIRDDVGGYSPILLGMYVTLVPFYFALWQTWRLLGFIDKNKPFSFASVTALKKVKYCALIISAMYTLGMPCIYIVADRDDAPGVVAIGLVFIGTSFVIATSAGVLQKLIETAVAIKSENDLTV